MPTKTKIITKPVVVSTPVEAKVNSYVYSHPNLQISPRKIRLVVNLIKKLSPDEALRRLKFTNSKSARILTDAVATAISLAKSALNTTSDKLSFESITINEGQKIKRMDKSHGSRFARGLIMKRHSRLFIKLLQIS